MLGCWRQKPESSWRTRGGERRLGGRAWRHLLADRRLGSKAGRGHAGGSFTVVLHSLWIKDRENVAAVCGPSEDLEGRSPVLAEGGLGPEPGSVDTAVGGGQVWGCRKARVVALGRGPAHFSSARSCAVRGHQQGFGGVSQA